MVTDFLKIQEKLIEKINKLNKSKNTIEHNVYVQIHNQYSLTCFQIDLLIHKLNNYNYNDKVLYQTCNDILMTHFIRIFSYIEYNIKQLTLLTKHQSLNKIKIQIKNHQKTSLRDILKIYNNLSKIDIANWNDLIYLRNVLIHNNNISDITTVLDIKNVDKIILKKGKQLKLPRIFYLNLTDKLLDSYLHLELALVADDIIDIDIINHIRR